MSQCTSKAHGDCPAPDLLISILLSMKIPVFEMEIRELRGRRRIGFARLRSF